MTEKPTVGRHIFECCQLLTYHPYSCPRTSQCHRRLHLLRCFLRLRLYEALRARAHLFDASAALRNKAHFCRRHMLGKCPHRDCWSTCTLSHDIHTPINIQVLKKHGLFGLNEAQLRVLLLQNDPCLLPEVCLLYNKGGDPLYGYCNLKDKCNKFHVCRAFVRGECRLQTCKRSHQLIYATSLNLLQDQGLSIPSVVNFQIIATYKHESLHERLERKDDSSAAPEHPQSPDKQGACTASTAEARPPVPVAAQLCTGPCPGNP
ncbi:zinc finger CCCH-type antiviral protein 1-like [Fukomys damarensis]|uniref:zinc finger CCCH-type antiviral protein 1-like n=1 Tax=Fukomys damarensis TaxID=885580 RepID=UPI00053F6AA3|nr:zinc finger CCCH-type antiviral protein 1-like [Fukomys damarensis]